MPFVMIDLLEGRTLEQKREIARQVTETIATVGKVDPEKVSVFFTEHSKEQVALGGKLLADQ